MGNTAMRAPGFHVEYGLLGEQQVPQEAYYGIHTVCSVDSPLDNPVCLTWQCLDSVSIVSYGSSDDPKVGVSNIANREHESLVSTTKFLI